MMEVSISRFFPFWFSILFFLFFLFLCMLIVVEMVFHYVLFDCLFMFLSLFVCLITLHIKLQKLVFSFENVLFLHILLTFHGFF
jgi:hypothetical protein